MNATLIVGACQAGVQIASIMRERGDTAPIVLVGEEAHRPYQRPPLSKGWIKGELQPDDVILRSREWFAERDIELVTGDRVVTVHRDADGTGVATTEGGRRIPFGRLALTTGASARRLPLEGTDYHGVHYLRDADQAIALQPALADEDAKDIVVIGGGFIGLETAAVARGLGKNVTVLEAAPRLVGRVVSEETSAFYLDAHRRRGIRVILDARISRILGGDARVAGAHGSVTGVELADGTVIPADLVLIGVGVVPRTELAEQLGLEVDGGMVVDSAARASDGLTVAAGDCTMMPNPYPLGVGGRIRLESVNNALEQAKIAAASLLGEPAEYRSVPWFWSDQGDLKLQIAGLSTGYDRVIVRGEPDTERFAVLYYRDGRLIAADVVNHPVEFLAVKSALAKGGTIPPEAAADTSVPLKSAVVLPEAVNA
ncbi:3-phenylpropionate/trans-cinnamate dioxygenase ferredoxin reductase subunit [Microbacterium ginsengiterrae]|uniref:3-phenylpropionate/trans-cinnamate dioxygenase ferredoxin reductase subunit n=1 Tax=Microbacterium ginsengiterrae TaxID=546115 RepID=A0A7W9FAY7_9MICO|nr:FAD-dependent oxidoreductase [Microbacterium ginsengiterrae]MBB5742600.1 3-phenylpropionate/trans-cinnamate dioxygenase ferredoxin reductase subunit [Microbacterium ginsengiterrae]